MQEALSANMDDRTMHELYLWPFADAVKAGAASFMCAYQRLNGSYACENSKAQNGILKTELGFRKFPFPLRYSNNAMYLTASLQRATSCLTGVPSTPVSPLLRAVST